MPRNNEQMSFAEKPLYISRKSGGPIYESSLRDCGINPDENPYRNLRLSSQPELVLVQVYHQSRDFASHLRQAVIAATHNFAALLR